MRAAVLLLLLVGLVANVYCATQAQWKYRNIYQIFTDRFARSDSVNATCPPDYRNYCGGTFKGIISKLDYIQDMGFSAIWISPIPENNPNDYHGYAFRDLWLVNSKFGGEADLIQLINECHKRDIYVMIDIVLNHVAPVDTDYSQIIPFNKPEHYHNKCQISNWNNQTEIEYCRLANLPDLNQDNAFVYAELGRWCKHLILDYKADGFRIDTVRHIKPNFWTFWKYQTIGDQTFTTGEVFDGRSDYVASYANIIGSTLSYPMFYTLRDVFASQKSMYLIRQRMQEYQQYFKDYAGLTSFIDNHDVQRFLYVQKDYRRYMNAIAFVLLAEGVPVIYQGTEQGYDGGDDPANREPLWYSGYRTTNALYQFIKTILQFKKRVINDIVAQKQIERYASNNFYAFSRGSMFVALTNAGYGSQRLDIPITYHPYQDGQVICDIFYPSVDCITVTNGQFTATLLNGEAKVFYPKDKLAKVLNFEAKN